MIDRSLKSWGTVSMLGGLDCGQPATAPASFDDLTRRDAAEARRAFVVILAINLVCMAVAGWLL